MVLSLRNISSHYIGVMLNEIMSRTVLLVFNFQKTIQSSQIQTVWIKNTVFLGFWLWLFCTNMFNTDITIQRHSEDNYVTYIASNIFYLHRNPPWPFSVVPAHRERLQTDEAVWVVCQYDWIPVKSHLIHFGPHVVAGVSLAECLVRYCCYLVVLQKTKKRDVKSRSQLL